MGCRQSVPGVKQYHYETKQEFLDAVRNKKKESSKAKNPANRVSTPGLETKKENRATTSDNQLTYVTCNTTADEGAPDDQMQNAGRGFLTSLLQTATSIANAAKEFVTSSGHVDPHGGSNHVYSGHGGGRSHHTHSGHGSHNDHSSYVSAGGSHHACTSGYHHGSGSESHHVHSVYDSSSSNNYSSSPDCGGTSSPSDF